MRKLFWAMIAAAVMLAAPAAAWSESDSGEFYGWGVVRAVGASDRHLLLQSNEGYELVVLEEDAAIRSSRGAPIAMTDIPVGAEVEYAGRTWEGTTFAFSIRVSASSIVVGAR